MPRVARSSLSPFLLGPTAFLLGGCLEHPGPPERSLTADVDGTGGLSQVVDDDVPDEPIADVAEPNLLEPEKVFAEGQVLEYHLTLTPEDAHHLEYFGDDEEYLPAQLVVKGEAGGDRELGTVGFRHKGAYTLHHCWEDNGGVRDFTDECAKLSYKIKFHEYDDETRFHGLKRLNLHAAANDQTKLRELLAYDMFRSFGVDGPMAAPAKVFVNGEYSGVFIAVEAPDGRFTKSRYPDSGDGNLYKETWPRDGLDDEHFEEALRTNEDPEPPSATWPNGLPDVSDMQAFSRVVGSLTSSNFAATLEPVVPIEHLLRYMAVDRASKNWDGVVSFYSEVTPHNFYWYLDDAPGSRWQLIPWDMDNTFWEHDPYMAPGDYGLSGEAVPEWNVEPANCKPISVWESPDTTILPPGCDPLHQLLASTQWSTFDILGQELLAGPMASATMQAKLAKWEAVLDPLVREDPIVSYSDWQWSVDEFPFILEELRSDFADLLNAGYIALTP